MTSAIFIHRGRNPKSDYLGGLITERDFIFDYRGENTLVMLWRAWRAAWKLPRAEVYLVEGGLCLWPVFFRKLFYPRIKIIMMVPEPALNWRQRSRWGNWVMSQVLARADYFLPISDLVADDLCHYVSKPFSLLHHYSTLDPVSLATIRPDYRAKSLLFIINRPTETGHTKGLDIVLRIFSILIERDPEWQLFLIGAGTENLNLSGYGIKDSSGVHLEGKQDPRPYFARSPYLLAPARYDAFPLAVVEACVAGCIPLISPTTGSEEFIRETDPSLIIDHHNPAAYAERILSLHTRPVEALATLGGRLRELAGRYTRENSIQELREAVQQINQALGTDLILF
ncbi:MAG: glycosyltransferase [Candidatus Liptonbacteria bacterium]|nr:glycosyltransferase [Candidatus Liptonbacteria bacterium]